MGGLIRKAGRADIPEMVRMAGDFIAASGTGLPFVPDYVDGAIRRHLVTSGTLSLVLDDDGPHGMLCAAVSRSPLAPVTIAEELVWWIDPTHRGRAAMQMLDDYEEWAKGVGCERMGMSALADTKAARIYDRRGLTPAETRHVKVF